MKVPIDWLKELVDLKVSLDELIRLLPLRTIGLKDITKDFIELDMKGYNRSDLLSMRGVAYEVGAITEGKVKFREADPKLNESLPKLKVEIQNRILCTVYCLAKIEGLRVGPSPEDWVKKLTDCGMRSVNNITDITNLVMLEFGQPLHAFDVQQVAGETITVREAKQGEKIITLDGKARTLDKTDLLITDPEKVLGIAGVMGGKNSEVSKNTTAILLEAAIFDPSSLRKTATRLGLQSEAAKRFYHGLTKKRLLQALDAAISMCQSLGGKLTKLEMAGDLADQQKSIKLTQQKIDSLIGVSIEVKEVENYLTKLHFMVKKIAGGWEVKPPYFRLDINIEEDLIEEVARMYGYEKIPAQKLRGQQPEKMDQSLFELIYNLKKALAGQGLTEVQTYSFFSSVCLNNLGYNDELKKILVRVSNPISSETEYLRQSVWPNLLEVMAKNVKQGFSDIAIFELGKNYSVNQQGEVDEKYSLAAALMNGSESPTLELSQIFNHLERELKLNLSTEQSSPPPAVSQILHPKRFLKIKKGGEQIGGLAEAHKRVTDKFGINQRVALLEFNLNNLIPIAPQ